MPKNRVKRKSSGIEADEVASLLDFVEHGGDHLTGQKRAYYEKTKNVILRSLRSSWNWNPCVLN